MHMLINHKPNKLLGENSMKQISLIALVALIITSANVYADMHETESDVMKADANNDGRVSFDEYKAAHEERMLTRFKRRDVNGDGFIDLAEKQVAKEKKQAKHQADKKAEQQALREKYQNDRKKRKKHFYKY